MLRGKPLADLTWADIEALKGVAEEGQQLDFKGAFDKTPGQPPSVQVDRKTFRRTIIETLVSFANAEGGSVVIGVEENPATDGLAGDPEPFPDPQRTAEAMAQSLAQKIEPRLPIQVRAIEKPGTGTGVLVLTVGQSAMAPHAIAEKHPEAYIRRRKQTLPMTIRELKDLTLASASGLAEVRARLSDNRVRILRMANHVPVQSGDGIRPDAKPETQLIVSAMATPMTPIDCGRLRPQFHFARGDLPLTLNDQPNALSWSNYLNVRLEPRIFGLAGSRESDGIDVQQEAHRDGTVSNIMRARPHRSPMTGRTETRIYSDEAIVLIGQTLATAILLRDLAGNDGAELALQVIVANRSEATFSSLSFRNGAAINAGGPTQQPDTFFPEYRFTTASDAGDVLHEVLFDFWRSLGRADEGLPKITFDIEAWVTANRVAQ